jgi:hypothetical protein
MQPSVGRSKRRSGTGIRLHLAGKRYRRCAKWGALFRLQAQGDGGRLVSKIAGRRRQNVPSKKGAGVGRQHGCRFAIGARGIRWSAGAVPCEAGMSQCQPQENGRRAEQRPGSDPVAIRPALPSQRLQSPVSAAPCPLILNRTASTAIAPVWRTRKLAPSVLTKCSWSPASKKTSGCCSRPSSTKLRSP